MDEECEASIGMYKADKDAERCGVVNKDTRNFRSDLHQLSLIPSRRPEPNVWDSHNKILRKTSAKFYRKSRKQSSSLRSSELREIDHNGQPDDLEHLPPLQYELSGMREAALIRKLEQCNKICNFNDPMIHPKSKEVKRMALNDICDFLGWHLESLDHEQLYEHIFRFLSVNLFRDLPPVREVLPLEIILVDEDDPIEDVAWPHLQLVYSIALTLIQSTSLDRTLANDFITEEFLVHLVKNFESLDSRERELLQAFLYNIYLKIISKRSLIRKEIRHTFLMFVEGERSSHGISELLDMMSSVISGFAVPIKEEHQEFLFKVLIPLHRPTSMPLYHDSLSLCMVQFIERDETLIDEVMGRLLPVWSSIQHSVKHLCFLSQVEDMLSKVHNYDKENQAWLKLLTRKVSSCIRSQNSLVSERALLFLNGDTFADFLKPNASNLIPILFPALYETSRTHWSATVTALSYKTLLYLMKLNSELFDYLVDIQSGNQPLPTQLVTDETVEENMHSKPIEEPYGQKVC